MLDSTKWVWLPFLKVPCKSLLKEKKRVTSFTLSTTTPEKTLESDSLFRTPISDEWFLPPRLFALLGPRTTATNRPLTWHRPRTGWTRSLSLSYLKEWLTRSKSKEKTMNIGFRNIVYPEDSVTYGLYGKKMRMWTNRLISQGSTFSKKEDWNLRREDHTSHCLRCLRTTVRIIPRKHPREEKRRKGPSKILKQRNKNHRTLEYSYTDLNTEQVSNMTPVS